MPESNQVNEEKPESSFLGKIRNEFRIELLVTVVCFLLALGLTTKVIVAITVACLRFAIPDAITAFLVLRHDPNRWHGIALALLFLAMGMCRTTAVALIGLLGIVGIGVAFNLAPKPIFLAGLSTCALIVYSFLLLIFPSTLAAYMIAKTKKMKLYFAHELTRARRKGITNLEHLNIGNSLRLIAIGSGISLSIVVCSSLFIFAIFPNAQGGPEVLAVIGAVFTAPPLWVMIFTSGVTPKGSV